MAPLLPLLPGVCGGAAITGAVAMARPGVVMVDCSMTLALEELDDGWPESVEEQGLLLLVWRHNFTNNI